MTDQFTPGIGDNIQTDPAGEESDRLRHDYEFVENHVLILLDATKAFTAVEDDATKSQCMFLIKQLRDEKKKVLGFHELEKLPHYRRGQACDQYFFRLADALERRDKKSKEGEADRLGRLLTEYDRRVLAEIREKQRLEQLEAERLVREAEEAKRKAAKLAEEARLSAERARSQKESKEKAAQLAEAERAAANVEAEVAAAKAEEARIATLRSSADIMRTRSDDGTLGTMAKENFAEVTDRATLNLEALRPYIPMPALLQALNAYAKLHGYSADESVQIKGAKFGKRDVSRVR